MLMELPFTGENSKKSRKSSRTLCVIVTSV